MSVVGDGRLSTTSILNMTLTKGHAAELDCCCKPVRWYFYPPKSVNYLRIFNGFVLNPDFTLRHAVIQDNATGRSTLRISDVWTNDTGKYECIELYTNLNKLDFRLTVLGKQTFQFCFKLLVLLTLFAMNCMNFRINVVCFKIILAWAIPLILAFQSIHSKLFSVYKFK
jgi:hypothetical protein